MARAGITYQQVGPWPRDHTLNRDSGSRFKTPWDRTLRILRDEVLKIQKRGTCEVLVAIGVACREQDIRVDGTGLKADARLDHPGVVVAFDSKHGPLKFYCDFFRHWRDNVHGVALTLERLRMADLYGVTRRGEQYTGWRALPPAIVTPQAMTVEEAARFLERNGGAAGWESAWGAILQHRDIYRDAYRRSAARLHPDTNGGLQRPEWATLKVAKAVLDQHHGVKP